MKFPKEKPARFLIIISLTFLNVCCSNFNGKNKLKYEDFDPHDFYEVVGRVRENRLSYTFPRKRILFYEYFLSRDKPLRGYEEDIDLYLKKGDKFIVLVNKEDSTISFFGYVDPRLLKKSFEKARKKANETFQ